MLTANHCTTERGQVAKYHTNDGFRSLGTVAARSDSTIDTARIKIPSWRASIRVRITPTRSGVLQGVRPRDEVDEGDTVCASGWTTIGIKHGSAKCGKIVKEPAGSCEDVEGGGVVCRAAVARIRSYPADSGGAMISPIGNRDTIAGAVRGRREAMGVLVAGSPRKLGGAIKEKTVFHTVHDSLDATGNPTNFAVLTTLNTNLLEP